MRTCLNAALAASERIFIAAICVSAALSQCRSRSFGKNQNEKFKQLDQHFDRLNAALAASERISSKFKYCNGELRKVSMPLSQLRKESPNDQDVVITLEDGTSQCRSRSFGKNQIFLLILIINYENVSMPLSQLRKESSMIVGQYISLSVVSMPLSQLRKESYWRKNAEPMVTCLNAALAASERIMLIKGAKRINGVVSMPLSQLRKESL